MAVRNWLRMLLAILFFGSSGCASASPQHSVALTHEAIRQSATPARPSHHAGEKLAETDLYKLFAKEGESWCERDQKGKGYASVSLVFKVDADYEVEIGPEYKSRFEAEIFPVIEAHCHPLQVISIENYIYGFRISDDDYLDYPYNVALPGFQEVPLSKVTAHFNFFNDTDTLEYDGIETSAKSIAGLHKRHAENEASAAKDRQEQEMRARELKEAEKAERRRQQEPESKGGTEPTGDDLAMAYAKYPRFLACPQFGNMEWCNIAPPAPIWLRLKGGNKGSCEAVVVGTDYHCTFSVEYECLVQGSGDKPAPAPITFMYCAGYLRPQPITTGVRRTSDGWELYSSGEKK